MKKRANKSAKRSQRVRQAYAVLSTYPAPLPRGWDMAVDGPAPHANADCAAHALAEYFVKTNASPEPLAPNYADVILVDLLADLMHWAHGKGLEFEDLLTEAHDHYMEEHD